MLVPSLEVQQCRSQGRARIVRAEPRPYGPEGRAPSSEARSARGSTVTRGGSGPVQQLLTSAAASTSPAPPGTGTSSSRGSANCAKSRSAVRARPGVRSGIILASLASMADPTRVRKVQLDSLGERVLLVVPYLVAAPSGRDDVNPEPPATLQQVVHPGGEAVEPFRQLTPPVDQEHHVYNGSPAGPTRSRSCSSSTESTPWSSKAASRAASIPWSSSTVRRTRSRSFRVATSPTCGRSASVRRPAHPAGRARRSRHRSGFACTRARVRPSAAPSSCPCPGRRRARGDPR